MVKAVFGLIVVIMVAMGITLNSTEVLAAEFIIEPLDYDFPTEIEDAASDGKNLVVMFHKNGCPYCDKMHKRVFPHPKVSKLYNEKFIMIIVNMSGDLDVITPKGETKSEKEFASKLLVRATPVFMFYGKDGSDALRLTGYQDPEMFTAAGKYISDGVFKDGTSFINYVRSMN